MTNAVNKPFEPAFHMPVIAPPPEGYAGTPADYYAAIDAMTTITITDVASPPELANWDGVAPAPEAKAVEVMIDTPTAQMPSPQGSTTANPEFRTIYAMMGGALRYVPAASPIPLDNSLYTTPTLYSPPNGADPAGSFVLRLWATDFERLQEGLTISPAPRLVIYSGVDEGSLNDYAPALIERVYPDGAKASLAKLLNQAGLLSTAASQTGAPADLVRADFLTAFKTGALDLMVRGGVPIGKMVLDPNVTGGSGSPIAKLMLYTENEGGIATPPIIYAAVKNKGLT